MTLVLERVVGPGCCADSVRRFTFPGVRAISQSDWVRARDTRCDQPVRRNGARVIMSEVRS